MFGHQDDQQDGNATEQPVHEEPSLEAASTTATSDQPTDQTGQAQDSPVGEPDNDSPSETLVKPDSDNEPQPDQPQDDTKPEQPATDGSWQHPGTPLDSGQESISDVISPAGGFPKRPTLQDAATLGGSDDSNAITDEKTNSDSDADELVTVKKQALEELSPLIDKLDLPPEDKFRTVMMMIQASDDETLVKAAYEAAHSIKDEKARAQALLDVVNEVNYFTQQPPLDDASEQES